MKLLDYLQTEEFAAHDMELLKLNVSSLDLSWSSDYRGGEEIENDDVLFVLEQLKRDVPRLANGKIKNYILAQVKEMKGGWHTLPFYGLADRAQIDYFRFKPANPPADKQGKVQKYLGAKGVSPRLYCPNVPEALWATIAARYDVEKTGSDFWEWILDHPEIPVIITEGEKKAFSGLSAGYVVVSLPGIYCGYKSSSENDDGSEKKFTLIPDLVALATEGRTILIAFDRDSDPNTKTRVQNARKKLAELFSELGCETLSIRWDEQHKGLDDLIFGAGKEALDLAIESARNMTPQNQEGGTKEYIPSALEMSKRVFKYLFEDKIRFDASIKQYWRYDGKGKWITCSDEYIFGIVQTYLEEELDTFNPTYVRNTIEFAKKDFLYEEWIEASNLIYLPFVNGVLVLKTKELKPHEPGYGFTWQLPRPYSADVGEWGNISKFLDSLCNGNNELKSLAIAFSSAILTGRSDLQKFLYLSGSGANGKGVFIKLLTMLVGKENTHATTISDLNDNRFEPANLRGKRLVLMTDEDKRVGGLSVFKSAIGGDPIRYERKGKDATNFIFKGMVVMAANLPTFVGDTGYAIQRRKVDFPCLTRIADKDRRDLTPELESDLTAFTTYLLSLDDKWVTDTIRQAGDVKAVKKLNWEMTVREDSVAAFYDERLVIDPNGSVPCGQLYKEYQSYCEQSGLKSKSIKNFTPSLLELCNDSLGHSIAKKKASGNNVIIGIRLREAWESEDDISITTGEKTAYPISKNESSGVMSIYPPHPPLSIQDKGLNPPLDPPPLSTSIHTTNVVNTGSEPLAEF